MAYYKAKKGKVYSVYVRNNFRAKEDYEHLTWQEAIEKAKKTEEEKYRFIKKLHETEELNNHIEFTISVYCNSDFESVYYIVISYKNNLLTSTCYFQDEHKEKRREVLDSKLNVGDSIKFKDGRTGIVEDYDEKYYYVKDNNTNIIKIKKVKDNDDFNYEVGKVNGKDIFDITTAGTTGKWEWLLNGEDDFCREELNIKGKIVQMSPNEYFEECRKYFATTKGSSSSLEKLKDIKKIDMGKDYIDKLKKIIIEKKEKFPIPVLDISYKPGQEGLHRMMVAGELFGWDTKFPVLFVETYDKDKQYRLENDMNQKEFDKNIEYILNYIKGWVFSNVEDFAETLNAKLYEIYEQTPITSIKGNILNVMIDCDETNDALTYDIDLNEINIDNR